MSKRVIITGAASGIGEATAKALRERGAQVVGLDLKGEDDLIACDVRDQESVDKAVAAAVERLGGGLDALVNCAGIGLPQSATEKPGPDALGVIDVNLLGTWRVTAAALPALRASHGRVVNISSGLAHIAVPFATAYGASKRAVVGYSEQLRAELGDEVTVTTVYPGYIRTPIHDPSQSAGIGLEGMVPAEPLGAAVETLVRAIYGKPARDLATTKRGARAYAALRFVPKGLVERAIRRQMRGGAKRGLFKSTPMTSDLLARLER
ncbi:MAG TPA: SDR family NAD(P)-dependent oxidoreductase [Solirubrobacterales bacterium]|nr:SDR family NAD(P)-dependent oxidoreductase [Solirubrobacterales bacterium]